MIKSNRNLRNFHQSQTIDRFSIKSNQDIRTLIRSLDQSHPGKTDSKNHIRKTIDRFLVKSNRDHRFFYIYLDQSLPGKIDSKNRNRETEYGFSIKSNRDLRTFHRYLNKSLLGNNIDSRFSNLSNFHSHWKNWYKNQNRETKDRFLIKSNRDLKTYHRSWSKSFPGKINSKQ